MHKAAPVFGKRDRKAWAGPKPQTTTERGYGWDHQKARRDLMKAEPLCRACRAEGRVTVATIADHIVNLASGGSRSASNLQPLCDEHHRAKTLHEAAAGKHGHT